MHIRVERKDGAIITIEVVGDRRVDQVGLHGLAGPGMQHVFTQEGYYDHSEAKTTAPPSSEERRLDVGPSEGAACVP